MDKYIWHIWGSLLVLFIILCGAVVAWQTLMEMSDEMFYLFAGYGLFGSMLGLFASIWMVRNEY